MIKQTLKETSSDSRVDTQETLMSKQTLKETLSYNQVDTQGNSVIIKQTLKKTLSQTLKQTLTLTDRCPQTLLSGHSRKHSLGRLRHLQDSQAGGALSDTQILAHMHTCQTTVNRSEVKLLKNRLKIARKCCLYLDMFQPCENQRFSLVFRFETRDACQMP